jgi:hypothetical protein
MARWVVGLVLVAAVATGGLLASTAPPIPAQGADRDCADFDTQREAQQYFESIGGPESDPDRLDANGDGRACDTLPLPVREWQSRTGPAIPASSEAKLREKPDARQTI